MENLHAMHIMDLEKHEDFRCSYKDTYDLKNEADLNEMLVKFLFDQGIPDQVRALTGQNYVLGDLVLRKSRNAKKLYAVASGYISGQEQKRCRTHTTLD